MKQIIFFVLGLIIYQNTEAQIANYQPLSHEKFRIMGVPQMLFLQGLRVDFDIPQRDGKEWIILSPEFYYKGKTDDQFDQNYSKLIGGRLGIAKRIHIKTGPLISGWYLSYGAVIEYYRLTRDFDNWNPTQIEGIEYLQRGTSEKTNNAFKPGIEFTIGQVIPLVDHVMLDCYIGTGFRYCFFDGSSKIKAEYAEDMYGKTRSGAVFLAGFRLGISSPK